jgi:glucosylglycerate synthase
MARPSILSDELLRQLMAVGQVDVLVGVPTFNHAATIAPLVTAIHVGLAKHFPRERTALINADGGSDDGTVERLREAPMADAELRGSSTLRTTHRVSGRYPGAPGRAGGLRTVLAAADLLQARAVVVFDADLATLSTDWVGDLARPVWTDEADFVLPIYPRPRFEGPLLSQVVHPLLGAAYRRPIRASVGSAFACSGRYAARMATYELWDRDPPRPAADVWLLAIALAEDVRLAHAHLGPCTFVPRAGRPALPELFEQVVGTGLEALHLHAPAWLARAETHEVPAFGTPCDAPETDGAVDTAPLAERFRHGVRDLEPLLRDILAPGTLGRLQAVAAGDGPLRLPDSLWAATVYEFAAAAHHRIMSQEHLTQALVSLYLGRTASYFEEIAAADPAAQRERLAAVERAFEDARPYLVERWNAEGGR